MAQPRLLLNLHFQPTEGLKSWSVLINHLHASCSLQYLLTLVWISEASGINMKSFWEAAMSGLWCNLRCPYLLLSWCCPWSLCWFVALNQKNLTLASSRLQPSQSTHTPMHTDSGHGGFSLLSWSILSFFFLKKTNKRKNNPLYLFPIQPHLPDPQWINASVQPVSSVDFYNFSSNFTPDSGPACGV